MEQILADMTVGMSEFKKNPAAVLREANRRPVAVLNHNPVFYMVEPSLLQAMVRELTDRGRYGHVLGRESDNTQSVGIDLGDG